MGIYYDQWKCQDPKMAWYGTVPYSHVYPKCSMVPVYSPTFIVDLWCTCWEIFQHRGAYGKG